MNQKKWSHPKHDQVGKEDTEDEFFENLAHHEIYSPTIDNRTLLWQSGPNMERRTWLVTFRWNCVKLAWAFINIMNVGNFTQQLVQEQHYVASSNRQTKCYVHRCVWLGWNQALAKGDTIILCLCKGTKCHQHKNNALVGCPRIVFCLQRIKNYKFLWQLAK